MIQALTRLPTESTTREGDSEGLIESFLGRPYISVSCSQQSAKVWLIGSCIGDTPSNILVTYIFLAEDGYPICPNCHI